MNKRPGVASSKAGFLKNKPIGGTSLNRLKLINLANEGEEEGKKKQDQDPMREEEDEASRSKKRTREEAQQEEEKEKIPKVVLLQ